ncbi:CRISPR-associated endonuclease Cas3'' [Lysobacter pythonis]|uniref:CRISPR-associated endonuclease Cas3 n=1 Tax=Solilutibacter pythonis TaxID=2483112 RepID=A0A3M2HH64_9GAMM|nr:CRISPR-associated endonuclease Cas3'' [Lysobacter pythonis]RMH89061.1 CRISPR-associated endonuclease Cas3'' [Lysobacter pythonis]
MDFYAHSGRHADKSDWQPLSAHCNDVGEGAAQRAAFFGAEALARPAGQLHDLGKYTEKFQGRLEGEVPKVDHSTWGAWVATQRYVGREKGLANLIAYAIAGHHAGLANGSGLERARKSLAERLGDDYLATLPPLLPHWAREIELPTHLALPRGFKPNQARGAFQLSLLTRMVFSCLVDADFVDTDNYYRRLEGKAPRPENAGLALEALRDRLDARLSSFKADSHVNRIRAEVLAHVRAEATHAPGLFSLSVPTGGGKTLASLAFALDHAIAHGLRRVIYVIPFTSVVEQTAAVFRAALGELGAAAVLEHHSAFHEDPDSAPQSIEKRRLAMENWDAPIVVTTAVQFFESLYADRPSRCRKLHNIAGSVVILDEAQTLPLDLLRPCVALLDELALNYRTSLVLCTATQPALRRDQGFSDGLENVHELAPDPSALYQRLRRVRVRHVGVMDDQALAGALREREQALCIVNNRRHARTLFDAIADAPGARHLTTLMYARHRSDVLADIRQRLKDGQPCRVVSTSLVEAGVDVDFPAVLRAEAGLDSIAQAAGRCNREGRRGPGESDVLVFAAPDWQPPRELEHQAAVFRAIEPAHRDDLLALDAVEAYFRELYARLGDGRLDRDDLLGLLRAAAPDTLPLETLAAKFRLIQTRMRPIIIPFDHDSGERIPEVDEALDDLAFAPGAARKLQPYLVQVPEQAYDALRQAHAIQPVAPERYADQFVVLLNPRLYDKRFGLHWEAPQFLEADRLVI